MADISQFAIPISEDDNISQSHQGSMLNEIEKINDSVFIKEIVKVKEYIGKAQFLWNNISNKETTEGHLLRRKHKLRFAEIDHDFKHISENFQQFQTFLLPSINVNSSSSSSSQEGEGKYNHNPATIHPSNQHNDENTNNINEENSEENDNNDENQKDITIMNNVLRTTLNPVNTSPSEPTTIIDTITTMSSSSSSPSSKTDTTTDATMVGIKGVIQNKRTGNYTGKITINGKIISLGTHDTLKDAAKKYDSILIEHKLDRPLNYPEDHPGYAGVPSAKRKRNSEATSKFKGVSKVKDGKFRGQLWDCQLKRHCNLGYFNTEIETAKAIDKYVIEHQLNKTLNFPQDQTNPLAPSCFSPSSSSSLSSLLLPSSSSSVSSSLLLSSKLFPSPPPPFSSPYPSLGVSVKKNILAPSPDDSL